MSKDKSIKTDDKSEAGLVLVVDDEYKNRKILRDLLEVKGYRVIEAENGNNALVIIKNSKPDVVLLDIMMPGIDGYEVCRRIKKNPETTHIPVLMITALQDKESRLKGIESGATDFITKPIDVKEVPLRVKNAVYTKKLYDKVNDSYEKLKELERLRDSLVHMVVHDMRQPITAISGYLQILKMHAENITDEDRKIIEESYASTMVLNNMINSLLDVNRLESGKMKLNKKECDLKVIVKKTIDSFDILKNNRTIRIVNSDDELRCFCDEELIKRVFTNLIGNAIKFTPDSGMIEVSLKNIDGMYIKTSIKDNGLGIPSEYHKKIFEKFGQVEGRKEGKKYSTGLGLTFCKLTVEAHGGKIGVDSKPGEGSNFWFTLPVKLEE